MVASKGSLDLEDKVLDKDSKVVRARWDTEAATNSAGIMEAGGVGGDGSPVKFVLEDHFETPVGLDNAAFYCKWNENSIKSFSGSIDVTRSSRPGERRRVDRIFSLGGVR